MTDFAVLGAGMVGLGAALALQGRGHAVTLIDRGAPGQGTSYGNAGVIQAEAAEPYAMPCDLATLLAFATGRSNDVRWHWGGLARMAPALAAYFRASAPARHRRISETYARLIARATDDHAALAGPAGAEALIRKTGLGEVLRDARALDAAASGAEAMRARHGIPSRLVDGPALTAEEPAIRAGLAGGLIWTGSWSTSDPGALCTAYAALFTRRGGRLLRGDALTLQRAGSAWQVQSEEGAIRSESAVIALGPWAPELMARLGQPVKMILKRGYHAHFAAPVPLRRPWLDAANGVVMSSMTKGLRVTTGAELSRRDAAPDGHQIDRGQAGLRQVLDLGTEVAGARWFGHRPCLPGMLPMVGPVPGHAGLWADFGHGHQGLTLGPTTGEILADMVAGDTAFAVLHPTR